MMTVRPKQTSALAIVSLVLGVLSVVLCLGMLTGLPAVICGHLAKGRIRRAAGALEGAGLALAGLILGYVGIGLTVVQVALYAAFLVPNLAAQRSESAQNACIANMRQIEGAVEQAMLSGIAQPKESDLFGADKYIRVMPTCPSCKMPYRQFYPPVCPGGVEGHELPR